MRTKDQFIEDISICNPTVSLVGNYKNLSTKTTFQCVHGHLWDAIPNSILRGHGCPKCYLSSKIKPIEQFEEELRIKKPNLKLVGEYNGMHKKAQFECDKNHIWHQTPNLVLYKCGCPICASHKTINAINRLEYVKKHFDVLSDIVSRREKIRLRCKYDNYEFQVNVASIFSCTVKCPVCGSGGKPGVNSKVVIGLNDLWTTHPHIAKLLTDPQDGYKYAARNSVDLNFTCPNCGKVESRLLSYVCKTMPYCQFCGDNKSYPERLLSAVLRNLGVEYEVEKKFDWCKFTIDGKETFGIFDFVFTHEGKNYIIETDSNHHYSNNVFGRNVPVMLIDSIKQKLAEEHGYIVIRIDCRVSEFNYIKDTIVKSQFASIFDCSSIDWEWCQSQTITSPMTKAAELWNNGIKSVVKIAKEIGVQRPYVRQYLKDCASQGLCDYTVEKSKEHGKHNSRLALARKVVLLNTGEEFESMNIAEKTYNVSGGKVKLACEGKRYYAGKHQITGQPLIWVYKDTLNDDIESMLRERMELVRESKKKQSMNRCKKKACSFLLQDY